MLEVSRRLVVLGDNRPTILLYPHPISSKVKHGLNRYNHTRFKPGSATGAEVEDEWILVVIEANAVASIFSDDAVSSLFGDVFDGAADVIKRGAGATSPAARIERPLSVIEQLFQTA